MSLSRADNYMVPAQTGWAVEAVRDEETRLIFPGWAAYDLLIPQGDIAGQKALAYPCQGTPSLIPDMLPKATYLGPIPGT